MLTQIVYLTVNKNKLEQFLIEVQANAQESVKEPGVRQFDVLQEVDAPEHFVLYEVYQNSEALEAHRRTDHFKQWQEVGVPLLSEPRKRVLYRPVKG
jgi:(4S)-4-hydroxy-5-phosphonooxypentane-2,3-dione isomerase